MQSATGSSLPIDGDFYQESIYQYPFVLSLPELQGIELDRCGLHLFFQPLCNPQSYALRGGIRKSIIQTAMIQLLQGGSNYLLELIEVNDKVMVVTTRKGVEDFDDILK